MVGLIGLWGSSQFGNSMEYLLSIQSVLGLVLDIKGMGI